MRIRSSMWHSAAVSAALFCGGLAHADVTLTDADSVAAKRGASATAKAGDKPGIALSRVPKGGAKATGSLQLTDIDGMQYFINTDITFVTTSSASGAASEASYADAVAATTLDGGTTSSTLNDAFDGYGALCLRTTGNIGPCTTSGGGGKGAPVDEFYNRTGTAPTLECDGRQAVFPTASLAGLDVSRKVYVPSDDAFARWLDVVSNPTAAPITVQLITANNLGSDSNTRVVATSSGDAVASPADTWVTSFQAFSGTTSSDPRLGHVLRGDGAPVGLFALNFVDGDDNPFWSYSVTVEPGETQILMRFVTAQPSRDAARLQSERLVELPDTAIACLTATERGQIVNFGIGPNLGVTLTAPAGVIAGAAFDYTIAVENTGAPATDVSVEHTLPAGASFVAASGTDWTCGALLDVVTCTRATLASGAADPITVSVMAPATIGTLTSSVTVESNETDTDPADNSDSVDVVVTSPATLSASKTVSGATMVGGAGTYTVTIANSGAGAQLDNAGDEFSDVLPAGLTLTSATASSGTAVANTGTDTVTWNGSIAAAGSVTVTIGFIIDAGAPGDVVSNQGTLSFDADGDGDNEASTLTDDPAIEGLSDPTTFTITGGAAVTATKTVTGTFEVGGTVTYTITLANGGSVAQADNAGDEFVDVLPATLDLVGASATGGAAVANVGTNTVAWNGAIATAGSVTITITATIADDTVGDAIANQGTANFDADGNGSNESSVQTDDPGVAGAADPTVFTVSGGASVQATKTVTGTFEVGGTVTYTIVLTNSGDAVQADNAGDEFVDVLPATLDLVSASASSGTAAANVGTNTVAWNGTIATAGSVTITIVATIADGSSGDSISNQGTVTFDADGDGSNDTSVQTDDPGLPGAADPTVFTVDTAADVGVTLAGPGGELEAGDEGSIVATVGNAGPDAAGNVVVTLTFPAGVVPTGASGAGFTCSVAANIVTCTAASLPVGNVAITATFIAPDADGEYDVSATISTDETDPQPANDSDAVTFVVAPGTVEPPAASAPAVIPTLGTFGLALLAGLLLLGTLAWRRSSP